jgi:hypothetical protein
MANGRENDGRRAAPAESATEEVPGSRAADSEFSRSPVERGPGPAQAGRAPAANTELQASQRDSRRTKAAEIRDVRVVDVMKRLG